MDRTEDQWGQGFEAVAEYLWDWYDCCFVDESDFVDVMVFED